MSVTLLQATGHWCPAEREWSENEKKEEAMKARKTRAMALAAGLCLSVAAFGQSVPPPVYTLDSSMPDYNPPWGHISGVAAADFNGNGFIDLLVPQREGHGDLLLVNDGQGNFTSMGVDLGLPGDAPAKKRTRLALWVDFDGDGRLDILVLGDVRSNDTPAGPREWTSPRLYRQRADNTFQDVSEATGMSAVDLWSDVVPIRGREVASLVAGDINGDGYPEVFITTWQLGAQTLGGNPEPLGIRILLNVPGDTPGTRAFEDVSIPVLNDWAVVPDTEPQGGVRSNSYWQVVLHDFDGDGLQDIFGAVDNGPNRLFLNTGSTPDPDRPGVFMPNLMIEAGATAPVEGPNPAATTDMGVALGDINNDGNLDMFVTQTEQAGYNWMFVRTDAGPESFTDPTTPAFVDRALELGLSDPGPFPHTSYFGWGWGCTLSDFNRDGWTDMAQTNGAGSKQPPRLMLNNNGIDFQRFEEDPVVFEVPTRGASLIAADFDRDGILDMIETTFNVFSAPGADEAALRYLRGGQDCGGVGQPDCPRWLVVRPRMDGGNSHAIGALVQVEVQKTPGTLFMTRIITAGNSMAGQEPAEAFFGMGNDVAASDPTTIRIIWPDGRPDTVLEGAAADFWDRVVGFGPCSPMDIAEPYGSLDIFDLLEFQNRFHAGDVRMDIHAPFGTLDAEDFFEAIRQVIAGCRD